MFDIPSLINLSISLTELLGWLKLNLGWLKLNLGWLKLNLILLLDQLRLA